MSNKIVYVALVITVILMMMHWNRSLILVKNMARSKYEGMYRQLAKETTNTMTSKGSCSFNWIESGFDPKYYEMGIFEAKRTASLIDARTNHGQMKMPEPVFKNPTYKMNPNRYLLPVLEGGPNNQVFCLRETIFFAIKLNRTLVIPKFYKHFTDSMPSSQSDGTTFIYPGHRINLKTICNLISCINLEDFQITCGGEVDSVMTFKASIEDNIAKFTGMSLNFSERNPTQGKILHHRFPGDRQGRVLSKDIVQTFHSEDRCVVYQRPLFNLNIGVIERRGRTLWKPAMHAIEGYPFKVNSDDVVQMVDITRKTQAPKYIEQMAKNFIKFIFGRRPFLTVHWRYNRGDFARRCSRVLKGGPNHGPMQKRQFCLRVLNYTAEDFVNNIVSNVTMKSSNLPTKVNIRDIYVASPPSERDFVAEASKMLWEKKRWTLHTSLELEEFINQNYNCNVTTKHLNDVVSTLEMEICARGIIFLQTSTSTWSSNVLLSRNLCTRYGTYPKLDGVIV